MVVVMSRTIVKSIVKYTGGGLLAGYIFISAIFGLQHLLPYEPASPRAYTSFADAAECTGIQEVHDGEGGTYTALACKSQPEIDRAVNLATKFRNQGMVEQPIFWICIVGFAAVGAAIGWRSEDPADAKPQPTSI